MSVVCIMWFCPPPVHGKSENRWKWSSKFLQKFLSSMPLCNSQSKKFLCLSTALIAVNTYDRLTTALNFPPRSKCRLSLEIFALRAMSSYVRNSDQSESRTPFVTTMQCMTSGMLAVTSFASIITLGMQCVAAAMPEIILAWKVSCFDWWLYHAYLEKKKSIIESERCIPIFQIDS